jgi:hypothetical protein
MPSLGSVRPPGASCFEHLRVRFAGHLHLRHGALAHRPSHRMVYDPDGLRDRQLHIGDDRITEPTNNNRDLIDNRAEKSQTARRVATNNLLSPGVSAVSVPKPGASSHF